MPFEIQILVDILYGALMVSVGFILNGFRQDIRAISDSQNDFERRVPETYARRDDLLQVSGEIKDTLKRIEDKLDRKVDKNG